MAVKFSRKILERGSLDTARGVKINWRNNGSLSGKAIVGRLPAVP